MTYSAKKVMCVVTKHMAVNLPRAAEDAIAGIAAGYRPQCIIVHGSFARGDYNRGSDLNLIIIKDTPEKFGDRIEHVLACCLEGIAVEPLVYTNSEPAEMTSEGNSFLEKALAGAGGGRLEGGAMGF